MIESAIKNRSQRCNHVLNCDRFCRVGRCAHGHRDLKRFSYGNTGKIACNYSSVISAAHAYESVPTAVSCLTAPITSAAKKLATLPRSTAKWFVDTYFSFYRQHCLHRQRRLRFEKETA